jgi:iron only hydrogenase large subunit-like protein
MMLGRLLKAWVAPRDGVDPASVRVVSIMPCVKKQGEAERPGYATLAGGRDVDHVVTTHELGDLLKRRGIALPTLPPAPYDDPLGAQTGSGILFGSSGGVMEAALRSVYEAATGEAMARLAFAPVRGLDGVKTATVHLPVPATSPLAAAAGQDGVVHLNVAVANGLGNAKALLKMVEEGRLAPLHCVEVMACPGGCIGGGGQPRSADKGALAARQAALYALDAAAPIRRSRDNPVAQAVYASFLGAPLSPAAHEHLHTRYWAGGPPTADGGGGEGGGDASAAAPPHHPHLPPDSALADALAERAREVAAAGGAGGGEGGGHTCEHCGAEVEGG